MVIIVPLSAKAAPYAAMVMDARTGKVLHSRNADTRLHPASLTKMMTLYVAFEAVERGEISLDKKVRISARAAAEPPSKLGLKAGQRIALRHLIRAASVKSANDAATAIAEAISGSEAKFARRMNRTAKALGMTRTTFKNAHGLTEKGHMSTARDMTILGRHVLYDYPQYYNLFSRNATTAGNKTVYNTNRRLLNSYRGADGIKTGYTRAAGYNLVSSAERGNERVIATVFGGKSSTSRNARIAELLDLGFRRAPSRAPVRKPAKPSYVATAKAPKGSAGKTIRVSGLTKKSLRPVLRPGTKLEVVMAEAKPTPKPTPKAPEAVSNADIVSALAEAQETLPAVSTTVVPKVSFASARPALRPKNLALAPMPKQVPTQEVVTRASTSGGRHWGVNVGQYQSRYKAEKVLLQTALTEMATLDGTLRKVVRRSRGYDANFLGMTRDSAHLACRRLQARNIECTAFGPG